VVGKEGFYVMSYIWASVCEHLKKMQMRGKILPFKLPGSKILAPFFLLAPTFSLNHWVLLFVDIDKKTMEILDSVSDNGRDE
jgi:hypothetical protein